MPMTKQADTALAVTVDEIRMAIEIAMAPAHRLIEAVIDPTLADCNPCPTAVLASVREFKRRLRSMPRRVAQHAPFESRGQFAEALKVEVEHIHIAASEVVAICRRERNRYVN